MAMWKPLKRRWIAALVSGKYRQGFGALRKDRGKNRNSYCCLGVLLDIIDPKGWGAACADGQRAHDQQFSFGKISSATLERLGIPAKIQDDLIGMNDSPAPFSDIAKFIDREL